MPKSRTASDGPNDNVTEGPIVGLKGPAITANDSRSESRPTVKIIDDTDDHENESTNASLDTRDQDIANAKKLCDITEVDIRSKSKEEVKNLIKSLNSSLGKVQTQANYWLDAKEQLVMESEMHNKMIASLVNLAQQKEKQAGSKRK